MIVYVQRLSDKPMAKYVNMPRHSSCGMLVSKCHWTFARKQFEGVSHASRWETVKIPFIQEIEQERARVNLSVRKMKVEDDRCV